MKTLSSKRGLTLIETLIWIFVFTMAMVALVSALISFYKTNHYALQEANAIYSAQKGVDVAVRALRTASFSNNGAYPIVSISGNQIIFYASVKNNDPLIQEVRLFVNGTSLEEGLTEPSGDPLTYSTSTEVVSDLSDYVQNVNLGTSTFLYYDQSGNLITNYAQYQNVRFVTVDLIVDVSTSTLPAQLSLISSAALRNLVTH